MDHGDGDHHDEQIDGYGDPQTDNGLIPSHICVKCHSYTFICDDVFVYMRVVVK